MSENKSESHEPASAPKSSGANKLVIGLAGGALLFSLVTTVLLVLNPTAKKLEVFNEELKTDLAESIATIHKKVDGLRSAELEWQAVLKKAKDKPDATYRVVNSKDGFLTLTEIVPGEPSAPEKESAEPHK